MKEFNLAIYDILIVIAYFVTCLFLGWYKNSKITTCKQFALGDSRISTSLLVMTTFVSFVGIGSTFGVIDKIYHLGIFFSLALLFEVFSWVLTYKIFATNIEKFKEFHSLTDIMESLYGNFAGWNTVIMLILQTVAIIAAQVSAVGYIFKVFFQLPDSLGVSLAFGVLIFYAAIGGIKAVIITDALQFVLIYLAIPIACAIAYQNAGGYHALLHNLPSSYLSLNLSKDNIWLFVSLAFYSFLPHSCATFIQRFLMSQNKKQITQALRIVSLVTIPFIVFLTVIGLSIYVLKPDLSSNQPFFYFIINFVPSGIVGLLICGILAVAMSTADSWLNTCSVCISHDLVKKFLPSISNKQELMIARLSTVVVGFSAVLLALKGGGFLELIWLADNFWQPLILLPLVIGFLGIRISQGAFIVSCIFATLVTCSVAFNDHEFSTKSLTAGVISSAIGLFLGKMIFKLDVNSRENVKPDF